MTTFFFVTDGISSALHQSIAAARGKDVRISGGAATVVTHIKCAVARTGPSRDNLASR